MSAHMRAVAIHDPDLAVLTAEHDLRGPELVPLQHAADRQLVRERDHEPAARESVE
jgi:hypothetical protein